jgi:ornithine carbamoyltransferase
MATYAPPEAGSAAAAPRHLLGLGGLSATDFDALLDLAAVMKRHPLAWRSTLEGRAIACLFEQPSTRSRVSLEVAVNRLGALPVMLGTAELRLADGDSIAETARVVSSYCDAIAVRTRRHRDLLEVAEHASVPVINARTDREYPCRALADCLTLRDRFGDLSGLPIALVGDCEAVADSLIEAAMLSGIQLRIAAPPALLPDPALLVRARQAVRVCDTPREAVRGAVAVYAAAWRHEMSDMYRVTTELMSLAEPPAVFMHAIPTVRGREVDEDVLDGPLAVTSEQTANLLPVEQAVLRALVTGDWEV